MTEANMSDDTTQPPADVRERVAKIVREAMEDAGRSERLNTFVQNSMWDYTDRILALLRTPRGEGEGEAQLWRKVGEEPPPNGVQVLAYDPRPDGYSYAGCWAYTLIRKGDQFYLDGERCDEEDRSRLQIEEWLWRPLPPYPGSRSKDDDVRDAAFRSEAQGEDTIPVSALRSEIAQLRAHRLLPYLAWARLCALAGGVTVGEDTPTALRSEAQGEEDVGEFCDLCGEEFDPRESGTVIGPLGQDDGVPRWYRCPRCARAYDAGYQQGQRDPRDDGSRSSAYRGYN